MDLGNCTQVLRLGSEHFHPSSHLAGLISSRDIFIPVIDFFFLFEFYRYFISKSSSEEELTISLPSVGCLCSSVVSLVAQKYFGLLESHLSILSLVSVLFLGPYSGNPIPMS